MFLECEMELTSKRAAKIIENFGDQRILVIGDIMLDRYIFGDAQRISPEAPVPVVRVERESEVPGGASNVGLNISTLGGEVNLCGATGADLHGAQLRQLLATAKIGIDGVVEQDSHPTTVKTRIIAQRQQVVRVDHENGAGLASDTIDAICERIGKLAERATGIIIEDYGKGVVRQRVVDSAITAAQERDIPIGVDPKNNHELDIHGVTIATPNRKETFDGAGIPDRHPYPPPLEDEALLAASDVLFERWGPKLLMTTLGADGMLLHTAEGPVRHVPTRAREVFDVSGAGDTVIAVCVLALAAGASYYEAAELANFAAGLVVGKLGTATISQKELLGFIG